MMKLALGTLLIFSFSASAQVNIERLLNQLKKPGPDVYSCQGKEQSCLEMYNNFCKELYSTKNRGNLQIDGGNGEKFEVRFGEAENGFSYPALEYAKAKLDALKDGRFPKDFVGNLDPSYVGRMEKYLKAKRLKDMSLEEYNDYKKETDELSGMFNGAWSKTLRQRVDAKIPGYYTEKQDEENLQEFIEAKKISDQFDASIYSQVWNKSSRFLKTKSDFLDTKKAYLKYLKETDELSTEDKKRFAEWIETVELEEPGKDHTISAPNCYQEERNAYYIPATHKIRICAGYFNTIQNSHGTFAHELSHALGISRAATVRTRESDLGKQTKALIQEVCTMKPRGSCPQKWNSYHKNFEQLVKNQGSYSPPLKNMRLCLMLNPKRLRPIYDQNGKETDAYIESVKAKSNEVTGSFMDYYARRNVFTELVSKKLPPDLKSAHHKENTVYLNPCADHAYLKDSDFEPGSTLFDRAVFVSAFTCSKAETEEKKFEEALGVLESLAITLQEDQIRFGAEISENKHAIGARFAEDTEERFADAMGVRVFSKMVAEKYPEGSKDWQQNRRNFFLSVNAKFCEAPSFASEHPSVAAIEKRRSFEPHSENFQRRMDMLKSPMREVLGCKKDFPGEECKP